MKIVVSGGTGVIGRSAVPALVAAGHDVVVVTRRPANVELALSLGAMPVPGDLFDAGSLVPAYDGADAVVNLATRIPVGYSAAIPGAWRTNDRLRIEGSRNVVAAARKAGVRRVVQESISMIYADAGDQWITEGSPLEITAATEPAAVAEAEVQEFGCDSRAGVVLRLGRIIGHDAMTAGSLRAAANGRPVVMGPADAFTHPVHTDDLGSAVVAALDAPSGIYNVGAEPVTRRDLAEGYAAFVGVEPAGVLGPVLQRLAGVRAEPAGRSLRVSSEHFTAQTGWQPTRPRFSSAWFDAAPELEQSR